MADNENISLSVAVTLPGVVVPVNANAVSFRLDSAKGKGPEQLTGSGSKSWQSWHRSGLTSLVHFLRQGSLRSTVNSARRVSSEPRRKGERERCTMSHFFPLFSLIVLEVRPS
jgi:hypothetical protein